MSRAAVKPARRSDCRFWIAMIVERSRDIFGVGLLNMCVWASIRPGSTVAVLRSMTCAPEGIVDFSLCADFGDALTLYEDHLLRPHDAGHAVEQPAGAYRGDACRCGSTRYRSPFRDEARWPSDIAPGSGRRWSSRRRWGLCLRCLRSERGAQDDEGTTNGSDHTTHDSSLD